MSDPTYDVLPPGRPRDEGAALIITLMVMALVAVLTTTVLTATVTNLGSTRRAQDSARALDAADAGITQAIAFLRSTGSRGVGPAPIVGEVVGSPAQDYSVTISPLPASDARDRRYRLTSLGTAGQGRRSVQVDVTLTLSQLGLPLGIFSRSVQGAGTPDLRDISIFTTGCVFNRTKIEFFGSLDAAYGIPPAVHSSKVITDGNGSGSSCSPTDSKAIHKTVAGRCRAAGDPLRWDQDSQGAACAALAAAHPRYYQAQNLDADAVDDVDGTYLQDDAALLDLFGLDEDPLPVDKLEELRAVARSQGSYFTTRTYTVPNPAVTPDAVMFFDLATTDPGATVDLLALRDTWAQTADCQDRSLLIVIDGGNLRVNGQNDIAASIVLTSRTYGEVDKGNGTPEFIGTMFANTVNLAGTIDISLNECFLDNLSPSLYSVVVDDYRELDR